MDPGIYADPDNGGYLLPICIRTMIPKLANLFSAHFELSFVLDGWVLILNTDPVDPNFWANWNPNPYRFGPETSARGFGDRSSVHNFLMSYVFIFKDQVL